MEETKIPVKATPGKPIVVFVIGFFAGGVIALTIDNASMFSRFGKSSLKTAPSEASITFGGPSNPVAQSGDVLRALLDPGAATEYGGYERSQKVLAFVDGVKANEIAAQIEAVSARQTGNRGYDVIRSLYQKWVQLDPAAALRHADGLKGQDRMTALDTVLSSWARKEPYEALAWMEENGDSLETQSAVHGALSAIAEKNPEEAIDLIEKSQAIRSIGTSYHIRDDWFRVLGINTGFLYGIWAEKDPQAAMARALAIPNSQERTNALQSVAWQWACQNPRAAWEWGSGLEHARDRDAVLQNIVSAVVGGGDTNQAIAFLDTLAPGQARRTALQQIVSSMAMSDPQSAYQFARSRDESGSQQQVYADIASQWARTDPKRAFEMALNELDPGHARNSAIQNIISLVTVRDIALAQVMLQQLDGESMRSSVHAVASTLAKKDINGALDWAGRLPEGDAKNNAYSTILSVWSQEDPEEALAYGQKIEDEKLRRLSLQSALNRWSYEDAVDAMNWAVENLEAKEQEELIPESLLGRWVDQDVAGSAEWVADLPEGYLRNRCIANLVSYWSQQDLVAAGQWLKKLKHGDGRDQAVDRYASRVFETDPEAALIWVQSISKEELRAQQVENFARRYLQKDQAKAKRWIANSSLPLEKQAELLEAVDRN